jgi:hypothetical protein
MLDETKALEASFTSKLVATVNPSKPVIDSVVLRNVGLKLPRYGHSERLAATVDVHTQLGQLYRRFLRGSDGAYLVKRFKATYPAVKLTKAKMLDFVLWQTRSRRPSANPA